MPQKLLLGPLLGIESDTLYTICFLIDRSVTQAIVNVNFEEVVALKIQDTYSGSFWRAEVDMPAQQKALRIN